MNHIKLVAMVREIRARFPIGIEVEQALLRVDRGFFVPDSFSHRAFTLDPLPLCEEQWISSPLTVAKMCEYIKPIGADSVLEIGCGSGYQAAVLSYLFRRVFAIERIDKLLIEARTRIKNLQIINISTKLDDGQRGWSQYAPFDRILFSASIARIPEAIFAQLSENGILIAPIQKIDKQIITRYTKRNGVVYEEPLEECVFVPIVDGTA